MSKIGSEIASYAKEHLTELKKEEEKSGRKLTQYDIANIMLSKGVLKKSEFNSWMNTKEGFNASVQTKQEKQALRQGNIWSISGYGGSGESYLESLVSFANKSSVEKA